MKTIPTLIRLAACFAASAALLLAQKKPLTLEAIMAPGGNMANSKGAPQWSPKGGQFLYSQGKGMFLYDVATGKSDEIFKPEDVAKMAEKTPTPDRFDWQNRGVRERNLQWFPDGERVLYASRGDLFVIDVKSKKIDQLTKTAVVEADPKLSPNGLMVSYRHANNLYVIDIASKKTKQLTFDGSETLWNGRLDWVYPEELAIPTAHWWSPDAKHVAYLQFDVSPEFVYPQVELHGDVAKYEPQRYPHAGTPNANVKVGVVEAKGGKTVWLETIDGAKDLIGRVNWTPESNALWIQKLPRVQDKLELIELPVNGKGRRTVLTETDKHWINLHDELAFVDGGKQFLWISERSGFKHLYRYSRTNPSEPLKQITSGPWEVTDVNYIDEKAGQIVYTSTEGNPLERHVWRIGMDGNGKQKLTQAKGTHSVAYSPDGAFYAHSHTSVETPPSTVCARRMERKLPYGMPQTVATTTTGMCPRRNW